MVVGSIVRSAIDGTLCASSSELASFGSANLSQHVNQIGGVGRTIYDFRSGLFLDHPCLGPGQLGVVPDVLFVDDQSNLFGYSLSDTAFAIRNGLIPSPGVNLEGSGLALAGPGNTRALVRLECVDDAASGGGDTFTTTLSSLDLLTHATQFQPLTQFTSSVAFSGLGSIGSTLYSIGFDPVSSTPPGLFELDVSLRHGHSPDAVAAGL